MANQLTVQEQDAIRTLAKQGWKIRRIAKELRVSRNTVRQYVRASEPTTTTETLVEAVLKSGGQPVQTDPPFDPRDGQIAPLSTSGKTGRKSLCADHDALLRAKIEAGLSAQRIFQDLQTEVAFAGSYQSV